MIIRTILFSILMGAMLPAGDQARVALPSSEDPAEFSREVEAFIIDSINREAPFGGWTNRELEAAIRDHPGDWESTLARMIADPEEYGVRFSRIAFSGTELRGTSGRPEVVEAAMRLFHYEVAQTMAKIDEMKKNGEPIPSSITVDIGSLIPGLLRTGSPKLLSEILDYMTSEAALKIGTLEKFTPKHVVKALREYGGEVHLAKGEELAALMEERERHDVAEDMRQSLSEIRGKLRSQPERVKERVENHAEGGAQQSRSDERREAREIERETEKASSWFWWLGGGVLLLALIVFLKGRGGKVG